ncbi:exopolysaccharide Pel transporter PelG [Castellaniella sp.]|uniref:exopolysaccharide Pel transporter PelG n=1 Tax=Castellaniella sp. TaxID=1955812 RepID=UPI003A941ECE
MAGIGFELRKILAKDSLGSTVRAYFYAGLISSGPFILSILGILLIGLLTTSLVQPPSDVTQFQVSVTYLMASSLIVSGGFQLAFTRYISDLIFDKHDEWVLPSYNAVCLAVTMLSGVLGIVLMFTVFTGQSLVYRLLMLMGFVILGNIWMAVIFLASIKQYRAILLVFAMGYGITVVGSVSLLHYGAEGLLTGFVIGHAILLLGANGLIWHNYRSEHYLSGEFFQWRKLYVSLAFVGIFFNLGIWADKFIFWYSATGQSVIGPLRASLIYDIPIFLAYLSIIPGMAMFLLRIETDFVDQHHAFYSAVLGGGSLEDIDAKHAGMVRSAREGLYEILKIQILVCLLVMIFGEHLLNALGISTLYMPLLQIDVVAAALQVLFLGTLNIFFYLDRRDIVLWLSGLFLLLNIVFTVLTLYLGPTSYGLGFAGAMLVMVVVSIYSLDRCFAKLQFRTYMMQAYG